MRPLIVLIAAGLATACTSTALVDPALEVSPYLAVYQLRGDVSVQSPGANPGDPPQDSLPQDMRQLGQDHHREDIGVRADFGDGFAGFRADYYLLDMGTARTGQLSAPWGDIEANDMVRVGARMDELRLGWVEPVLATTTEYRDRPLKLKLAAGGVFAHRAMTLSGQSDDASRTQSVDIEGDVVYAALRARAEWRDFTVDLDYAISPELALSGDFDGVLQDVEGRLSYQMSQRDIRFFAGWRYSDLKAKGQSGGLAYDADLNIDGFQFGFTVTF